ncbi:MAG: EutN/CcmL family microcompartment protein [Phycisphaerales bacterium]
MQLATIKGRATATVKHPSLAGCRMLLAQMLDAKLQPEGDPVLIIDRLGAGQGDMVMITSDGLGLRQMLNDNTSPARWWTVGIVDHHGVQMRMNGGNTGGKSGGDA